MTWACLSTCYKKWSKDRNKNRKFSVYLYSLVQEDITWWLVVYLCVLVWYWVYPLSSKLIIEFTRTVCGGINQLNILIWSLGLRLTLHLLLMTGYSLWKLIQPKLEKTVGKFSPVLGSIRSQIPMVSQWFPQLQCFNVSRDNGWKMLCQTWRRVLQK